jgi:hypothetical protein
VLRYTHQRGMIYRRMPLDEVFVGTDLGASTASGEF